MAQMNQLSFEIVPFGYERCRSVAVAPLIDSVSLIELVARFEEQSRFDCAGKYAGLVPAFFRYGAFLDDYFLGKTAHDDWFGSPGKIAVLGCECGEPGCWPLLTIVGIEAENVTWSYFEQPFRKERDYSQFGPFVFDRSEYVEAVSAVGAKVRQRATE